MTTAEPQKIYLKDYESPHFQVQSLKLQFDLHEEKSKVTATSEMIQTKPGAPLVLNGQDFKLLQISINSQKLTSDQYQIGAETLTIAKTPEKFTLEVITELEPQKNTSLEGLYKSNDVFCTQCEAQGFRKITYFLDRPDVMTSFDVTIEADEKKYPVLLSNGDRIKIEKLGHGRHKAYWKDPHKKPCYLFALVAGDLGVIKDEFTTKSGRKVNLEVYATHGKQDRCWHAMDSLKKSMKWDEDAFGREYDLNDYMIVAIDDFNAGAMENKGLNIFNSRLVLADSKTATDNDFHAIESVVAHEYFHNWTGNRVTLRDWFQLSLKEGLTVYRDQEFSADVTDRGVQRIKDVDALRERQFPEDAGPNAHPVRPESCLAVDNFFTMTIYEKGAELIRMMQMIVGRKGFRKGMDNYFAKYDGQAVTTEDFANAISEPNGKDFSQLKLWYNQAGTPVVEVQEKFDATQSEYHLTLKQTCPPTPGQKEKKPFHIPIMIGLLDDQGHDLKLKCNDLTTNSDGQTLIELKKTEQVFVFTDIKQKPHLSLLRQFSAPVNLKWNASDDELYFLIEKDTDGFNRREQMQKMALRVFDKLIKQVQRKEKPIVDSRFIQTIGKIIADEKLDTALKSLMLSLPTDAILAQNQDVLDAQAFLAAREAIVQAIASTHKNAMLKIYHQYHGVDTKSRDPKTFGHRKLKNMCLQYLAQLNDAEIDELVYKQFINAQNMTDQVSAMMILADSDSQYRPPAVNKFHEDWKHDPLILNKWFAAQAFSTRRETVACIKELTEHPSFNMNNPNHVYSLIGAFGNNLVLFNDPGQHTYDWYADKIIEIDAKNPQVAARLCAAFNFVGKLPPELKERALKQIKRIVDVKTLSKNSRELLQSTLG